MSVQSPVSAQQRVSPDEPALAVEAYMRTHLSQYIQELSGLCAIDSGTYYKTGVDEVARHLTGHMRSLGMDVTVFEHEHWGNDILGTIHGQGRGTVLLLGHIDTVYPTGTAATRPVRYESDTIYGPGVYDMKGCVLAAIYGIEALIKLDYRSFGEIRFLCVSDEEVSNRHSKDTIYNACQDCDGVLVLEGARENGDLVSARKGGSWYKLSARGHAAHAGVEPEKGCNAIVELAHQIVQFQSLHGWREGITINVGRVAGGIATNVVPDYAEVTIDLRFQYKKDRFETEQRWHEMLQHKQIPGVELTLETDTDNRDPMTCTDGNLQLVRYAQKIARTLGFSVNHAATGGISDANYASDFGYPTLDGLGPVGGLDHSPNEYLVASSIAPRTALLAGLITTIGA